ncbi:MAG TPA: alcohol dehydrogenase [Gammaproteobacteria bacterium]|nr:alcohol dehydrogenase [Gammaproteobacteria bacterium]
MKAVVINQYGGSDQLVIRDIPDPEPQQGEVLIKIRAFGINRAETYMRRGLWGEVAKVSGIECVGRIEHDPSGRYSKGQKVAAIMGGMGRTRNGSYAELTCLPSTNVFPVETSLSWTDFAAIPESYATAWSCLHENMRIEEGHVVFIRGGTSALGLAAINIAAAIHNVSVVASTRQPGNVELLKKMGCTEVLIENENLSEQLRVKYPEGVNSVLEIVGNSTLLDSMKMPGKGGVVCYAGLLGGSEPISFNPLNDMPPSVSLNFFASFMLGTPEFPLKNIPMQQIIKSAEQGHYKIKPAKVIHFNDIAQAHDLMERNVACGKIVVCL